MVALLICWLPAGSGCSWGWTSTWNERTAHEVARLLPVRSSSPPWARGPCRRTVSPLTGQHTDNCFVALTVILDQTSITLHKVLERIRERREACRCSQGTFQRSGMLPWPSRWEGLAAVSGTVLFMAFRWTWAILFKGNKIMDWVVAGYIEWPWSFAREMPPAVYFVCVSIPFCSFLVVSVLILVASNVIVLSISFNHLQFYSLSYKKFPLLVFDRLVGND